ncbi:hypothetical protein [Candidatus Viridilinea mediisalina]|uniref:Uncharacterized protein n=1 Tax=Candidatus Viridilinea mediisalina TaxID=2024553 RepID=A0A2A6RM36_9CHLR|nr:hypothetical protein [Candidatus Viridilinea mediisalina]PDW04117.1 hypothetical protein CJ255_05340 [Candidatus Viridilinea mediisalina]
MSTRPYLGINVNAASVDEMLHRGLIEEGETLLALFDGVLLDERRRRVGGFSLSDFVALTDRRVITWARGFFNDTVDGFEWKDMDVVQAETWDPWHGRVVLAFRLPAVAPRKRRIAVNGSYEEPGSSERVVTNTFDFMPADDVNTFSHMVEVIGDQIMAGVTGEPLVEAFFAEFPPVEREQLQPFFNPPEPPAPEPEPEPVVEEKPRKRRWWPFGSAEDEPQEQEQVVTPGNLIAAYEHQRVGVPAGSGISPLAMPTPASSLAHMSEQPSMYQVSRSLRLALEVPRKMMRGVRRATDAVSGATEMVGNMQDPRVRRNAMRGIYHAASQHEAQGGPFAPVVPVVRAAVRLAEPDEDTSNQKQSKRVSVRSNVRRGNAEAPAPVEPMGASFNAAAHAERPDPQVRRSVSVRRAPPSKIVTATGETVEPPAAPEPQVRRSVSVRRVEPAAPAAAPSDASEPQVRRTIAVRRVEPAAPAAEPTDTPEPQVGRTIAMRRREVPVEAPVASEASAEAASELAEVEPSAVPATTEPVATEEPAEGQRGAPVRRIAVGRPDRVSSEAEPAGAPKVVSYNGNGMHQSDDQA